MREPTGDPSRRRFVQAGGLGLMGIALAACGKGSPTGANDARTGDGGGGGSDNLGYGGSVLAAPLVKPTETFADTAGHPYDIRSQTKGLLTLLFFGYTSCPDVCPVHLGILASALSSMTGPASKPKVLFVGVDTKRDTPERMRTYLDHFNTEFIGLTAAPATIDAALAELKLPATVFDKPAADGSYAVGHASQILVYGSDDRCHIVYPFGTRTEDWVHDLPRIMDQRWPK